MIALGTFFADSASVHTYPVNPEYESAPECMMGN